MENNQSTQHHSSQLNDSKEHLNRPNVGTNNLNSLPDLIKRSPWLIWSGLWILLLATSVIAIFSLTHPLGVEQEPEPKPIAVEKPTGMPLQPGRPLLWLAGAAALAVGVGSLVILKRLNSSVQAPQLHASAKRGLTRRQQRKLLLQENLLPQTHSEPLSANIPLADEIKPVETMPLAARQSLDSGAQSQVVADDLFLDANVRCNNSLNSQTEVPLKESQALNSEQKMSSAPGDRSFTPDNHLNAEVEPVVTVLLPEESDLVDSADESLAEVMDIRKHRSLSSILHDS